MTSFNFIQSRMVRILAFASYKIVAANLPDRPFIFRRLRALCVHLYARDVSLSAKINRKARISPKVSISRNGGVGAYSVISGEVYIGRNALIGPGCVFITGDHPVPTNGDTFVSLPPTHASIRVEDDVFIGAHSIILPGVTIGRGAAVGAGAVVAKNVHPGAVVVGNPAREIKRREV